MHAKPTASIVRLGLEDERELLYDLDHTPSQAASRGLPGASGAQRIRPPGEVCGLWIHALVASGVFTVHRVWAHAHVDRLGVFRLASDPPCLEPPDVDPHPVVWQGRKVTIPIRQRKSTR